jgi:hypothetical protein
MTSRKRHGDSKVKVLTPTAAVVTDRGTDVIVTLNAANGTLSCHRLACYHDHHSRSKCAHVAAVSSYLRPKARLADGQGTPLTVDELHALMDDMDV